MAFAGAIHDDKARVLRVNITSDESDNFVKVDLITFYRTGQDYNNATNGFSIPFSGGVSAETCEVAFGTVFPPPTHLSLWTTHVA